MKGKNGFLAIDALLAVTSISVMAASMAIAVKSEIIFKRSIEEKWESIKDRESEILSSIEAGCALGCLTALDLP